MKLDIKLLFYYADKEPHLFYQQFFWFKNLYRKINADKFLILHRELFKKNWLKFYKNELYLPLAKRQIILTDKGEKVFRSFMIDNSKNETEKRYYRKFRKS